MAYIVRIQTGKGKNKSVMQSIGLPNKERVRAYVKRNPLGRWDTPVKITNTTTKKSKNYTKAGASLYGRDLVKEFGIKRGLK